MVDGHLDGCSRRTQNNCLKILLAHSSFFIRRSVVGRHNSRRRCAHSLGRSDQKVSLLAVACAKGSQPGFEPGTTSTLKTYHTPRPLGLCYQFIDITHFNEIIMITPDQDLHIQEIKGNKATTVDLLLSTAVSLYQYHVLYRYALFQAQLLIILSIRETQYFRLLCRQIIYYSH